MSATMPPFAYLSTPFADWSELPSKAHSVQFYGDDAVLLDGLSRFIGGALGAGDAAIVIATETHRQGLWRLLEARGLDPSVAQDEGRFLVLDALETLSQFTVNGSLSPKLFRQKISAVIEHATNSCRSDSPRVAAFGEMVALLWTQGKAEQAVQLEEFWNDLSKTYSFHLRCAYPISGFDQAAHIDSFRLICAEHSHVLPSDTYTSFSTEDQRIRTVTEWQQKALVLETEIAERKKTEQALRDSYQQLRISEERLRLTQRAAHIGTWELDVETDEFVCSEEACEMLGLSKEAALTKQAVLGRMSYMGDRESFLKALFQTIHKNRDFETEFRVGSEDQVLLLAARGKMFFNQGRPLVIGVLIDISDAAKALETHRKETRSRAGSKQTRRASGRAV
ncbi:MAG: MEDS domain-containing protein [Terriglobales bacterium]|jgi:PAS domain S-box-containing protein